MLYSTKSSDRPSTGTPGDVWYVTDLNQVWYVLPNGLLKILEPGFVYYIDGAVVGPQGQKGDKGDTGATGPQGQPGRDATVGSDQFVGVQGYLGPVGNGTVEANDIKPGTTIDVGTF